MRTLKITMEELTRSHMQELDYRDKLYSDLKQDYHTAKSEDAEKH